MDQSDGVAMTIIGVVTLIAGIWLKDQWMNRGGWVSLDPLGWLLIAIGAAVAIIGIWMWTSQPSKTRKKFTAR